MSERRVSIAPQLPERMGRLRLTHVPLDGTRVDLTASGSTLEVKGLRDGIELLETPLRP